MGGVAYGTNIVVLQSSIYGLLCFIDCLDIGYYFVEAYFLCVVTVLRTVFSLLMCTHYLDYSL